MPVQAAVLREAGHPVTIEPIEVLPPQEGEVQVRIHAAGVCHSDLHVMKGDLPIAKPIVMGHEGAGIVEAVGSGVKSVSPGDHVIMLWRLSCGNCDLCRRGRPALCELGTRIRATGLMPDGHSRFRDEQGNEIRHFCGVSTFSELTTVPEKAVVRIRSDFPLEKAALLGCGVITGVGAVLHAAEVRKGDSVAVFGCGGIGLNAIQGARIAGAETIIGVDIHAHKLEDARAMGASHGVNSVESDPVEAIREITGGLGVDHAFEAIGAAGVIEQAFQATAKAGRCVVVGITAANTDVSINANELVYSEKSLIGSLYGTARPRTDLPKLMELHESGELLLDELLTRTFALAEINEAYEMLERGQLARGLILPGN